MFVFVFGVLFWWWLLCVLFCFLPKVTLLLQLKMYFNSPLICDGSEPSGNLGIFLLHCLHSSLPTQFRTTYLQLLLCSFSQYRLQRDLICSGQGVALAPHQRVHAAAGGSSTWRLSGTRKEDNIKKHHIFSFLSMLIFMNSKLKSLIAASTYVNTSF